SLLSSLLCAAVCPLSSSLLLLPCALANRDLLSFPTRRSSDLSRVLDMGPLSKWVEYVLSSLRSEAGGSFLRALEEGDESVVVRTDRKSTRLNSSHVSISYAVFCLKTKSSTLHARNAARRACVA